MDWKTPKGGTGAGEDNPPSCRPPSRRDVLRRGLELTPGLVVLAAGGFTFSVGATRSAKAAPVAIRREIHDMARLDPQRFERFCAAIGEMKRRSAKDPRDPAGWLANANMHKEFCSVPETRA